MKKGRIASERYQTSLGPASLVLTQELANTIEHPRTPTGDDLLATVATAQPWLAALVAGWCRENGVPEVTIRLTAAELTRLRTLRDKLRQLLDGTLSTEPVVTGSVEIEVGGGPARLLPEGAGVAWLASAVALECALASRDGELARLKLCRNPRCAIAFYDRSKNRSGAWHDVERCGNTANVRAYRKRQRAD